MVFSSSTDGTHWSAVSRIPLDAIGSNVDHFIAGLGADAHTSGSSAHLGLTYYYYPVSNCGSNCQLFAGFSLSRDGGQTWTPGRQLGPSMQLSWLPQTVSGRMVADYVTTVFPAGGRAFPVYSLAFQPLNGLFQQAIYTASYGYSQSDILETPVSSANDKPIPGAKSDHPMRTYYDMDNYREVQRKPVPPR
jgi:hypothetical protein